MTITEPAIQLQHSAKNQRPYWYSDDVELLYALYSDTKTAAVPGWCHTNKVWTKAFE